MDNGFQKVDMKVKVVLIHPEDQAETTVHKELELAQADQDLLEVDQLEEMQDMVLQPVFRQVQDHLEVVTALQLLRQKLLQLVALVIKALLDHPDPKAHTEIPEKMEMQARMLNMERMQSLSLPNLLKFVLSVHKAHKDHQDRLDLEARQGRKELQENHQKMEFPENKVNKVNQEVKEDQAVKDHEELQANQADLFQYRDHKLLLDHQDTPENLVQKVNQAQTDNHSKDHLDYPEMLETQDAKEDLDQKVRLVLPGMPERKEAANIVRLQELHLVIKPFLSRGHVFSLPSWINPLFCLLFFHSCSNVHSNPSKIFYFLHTLGIR